MARSAALLLSGSVARSGTMVHSVHCGSALLAVVLSNEMARSVNLAPSPFSARSLFLFLSRYMARSYTMVLSLQLAHAASLFQIVNHPD